MTGVLTGLELRLTDEQKQELMELVDAAAREGETAAETAQRVGALLGVLIRAALEEYAAHVRGQ
jgi:hypothetical protein